MPTVDVIVPTNADSNVESAVGVNPQSALGKEGSGDNLATQVGVCAQIGWCVQVVFITGRSAAS